MKKRLCFFSSGFTYARVSRNLKVVSRMHSGHYLTGMGLLITLRATPR